MTENTSTNENRAEENRQHYQAIGETLRSRRLSLGQDLKDVAAALRLPGMVIDDIEGGRADRLSGIYRRGYIRNYAQHLGLDADALLAPTGEDRPPDLQRVLPAPRRRWQLEKYLKIATYALVTTVIVPPLVYFYVAGGSRILERQPDHAAETRSVVQSGAAGVERDSSRGERPDPSPAGHVSASALPLSPLRPAVQEVAPSSSETLTESVATTEELLQATGSPLAALELELLGDSWIEIHDADGQRLEYDLLRAGQSRSYEGQAPFTVLIGRANAVSLSINGEAVVWEGHDRGDIAQLRVGADGEVER